MAVVAVALALTACRTQGQGADGLAGVYVLSSPQGRAASLVALTAGAKGRQAQGAAVRQAGASTLAMDDQGRFWVGGKSVFGLPLATVSLVSADRTEQQRVPVAENPGVGMAFADGKMFIAASKNGFGGSVTEVDTQSLATRTTEIAPPPASSYILTALAVSGDRIVVSGLTNGPEARSRYGLVTVLDRHSLQPVWRSQPLENVDVWKILVQGDDFILLNVASAEQGTQGRADLVFLKPGNVLQNVSSLASPLWGEVADGVLYTYHNASWNSRHSDSTRFVSTLDLTTGQARQFPLPDGINAGDMALAGGKLLLAVDSSTGERPPGVYSLDLQGGELRLIRELPGASRLLVTARR